MARVLFILLATLFFEAPVVAQIDAESYSIIKDEVLGTVKRSVEVRLRGILSEAGLAKIAREIRGSSTEEFERTFIVYYLPGQTPGSGGWATSHFNPDLEVTILGLQPGALGLQPGAATYRVFTSTSGKELRARLLAVEGEKARLRVSDGKELVVPLEALSEDDRKYIEAWDPKERFRAGAGAGDGGAGLAKRLAAEGFMMVPLSLEGKTLSVKATVNGKEVTLAFDSGRVLTMIDRGLAEQVGVEVLEDIDFGEFRAADGSVIKVVAGSTKAFKLGDAEIPAFELGVVDFARVGMEGLGVVGSDVLQYFDGLVDWAGMRVFLKPQA